MSFPQTPKRVKVDSATKWWWKIVVISVLQYVAVADEIHVHINQIIENDVFVIFLGDGYRGN